MINRRVVFLWGVVLIFIVAFLGYFLSTLVQTTPQDTIGSGSIFDYSDIDFQEVKLIEIKGEAEIYIDTFLTQEDFDIDKRPKVTELVEIPSKWNSLRANSTFNEGHGYGTYHYTIIVPKPGKYGMKIKDYKMAYRLYVDGVLLGGSGVVGRNQEEMTPSRYQKEFYFVAEQDSIDIIIHVSNFHHRKGGATGPVLFGSSQNISAWKASQVGIEAFIIGLLFILFIYHFALYVYRPRDTSIIYFSLLCLSMLLRTGYIGERIFLEVFEILGWNISTKIEYISFMGLPIFTGLFINSLFPKEIPKWLVWVINSISIFFILIVLFFNPTIYSYTPILIQFIIGPAAAIMTIMLFVATLRKREYALQVFFGFFFFFMLSVHDAISYTTVMDSIYLMPLGLFIVCFSQAYVLAQKTSSAYIRAEDLAVELKNYAVNLEKIVQDRTHEIQEQKEEIGLQKESIELKAEELRTSNDNLRELADFKKNMTNMMIHDLKNPISNIIGFASLPGNIDKYKEHIHASGWKMLNMIQNMLDIEKHETSEIKLNIKGIDLQKLVNEALENTRYMVESSELHFRNNVKDGINIQVDETMINRVLSNIFSNAAKYAKQDGIVKVSSEKIVSEDQEEFIKVNIFNDGEAIPENQLDTIFKKYSQASSSKEKKYHSSGIGLAFCKLAINAHGGKIGAVNEDEIGVTFWFTLPLTKPDSN